MAYLADLRTIWIPNPNGNGTLTQVVGGSFRGKSFLVSSHQFGSGRRISAHEFPGRDDPFNEDMGRSARSVSFDAHLVGDDVMAMKLALLDACEQGGVGKLVHPYLGTKNARCASISISENSGEKRYVGISLSFLLDPDVSAPAAIVKDSSAAVVSGAEDAKETTTKKTVATFSLISATKATINAAVSVTNKLLDGVESARTSMRSASAYVSKIGQVRANLELLVMDPTDLIARLTDIVTTAEEAVLPSGKEPTTGSEEVLLRRSMVEEYLTSAQAAAISTTPTGTTKAKADQQRNQDALSSLIRELSLWSLAKMLISAKIDSIQDASDLQDRLQEAFDAILSGADDPETYQAAQGVLSSCIAYLRDTSANLATLQDHTPKRTVPSLVLAYEIYGDVGRAGDIVTRNGIAHPGFIPGGQRLEVLSK